MQEFVRNAASWSLVPLEAAAGRGSAPPQPIHLWFIPYMQCPAGELRAACRRLIRCPKTMLLGGGPVAAQGALCGERYALHAPPLTALRLPFIPLAYRLIQQEQERCQQVLGQHDWPPGLVDAEGPEGEVEYAKGEHPLDPLLTEILPAEPLDLSAATRRSMHYRKVFERHLPIPGWKHACTQLMRPQCRIRTLGAGQEQRRLPTEESVDRQAAFRGYALPGAMTVHGCAPCRVRSLSRPAVAGIQLAWHALLAVGAWLGALRGGSGAYAAFAEGAERR